MLGAVDPKSFQRAKEVAKRRSVCSKSCEAFIDLCVKIEDPDTDGIVIPFALWKEQREVLQEFENNRLIVALKARQLGITWLGLSYCLWSMIFKPGFVVVGLSKGEDEAKELVRRLRFILENCPRWLIRHVDDAEGWEGPTWEYQVLNVKIYHGKTNTSRFLGEAASKDSGRSFTANIILIDEWCAQNWAYGIWQAAYPTVNRPTGGKVIGISTAKPGTLMHEIWKAAPTNGFKKIFLPWWVDPRRTQEWYEATKLAAPRTVKNEYPATETEAWEAGVGLFFPSFDYRGHTYEPDEVELSDSWTLIRCLDWGFNAPHCVLWARVDYDNRFWFYRELYDRQKTVSIVAKEILDAEKGERIDYAVGDTSIWNRIGSTGPTVGEEFLEYGIIWDKADKDRVNGWNQFHKRLRVPSGSERPLMMISRKCTNFIREIQEILQSKTNSEDLDTHGSDHSLDCARYGLMSRPLVSEPESEVPPWYKRVAQKQGNWWTW